MTMNKNYLLALNRIPAVGPQTIKKLLQYWPDLAELFALKPEKIIQQGIPAAIAQAICSFSMQSIENDLQWEQSDSSHHILTWEDIAYPRLLKEIYNPPPILYAKGQLSWLQQQAIAVIGSRHPSYQGKETAKRFALELASQGLAIVSGLAAGIDTEVHLGALASTGATVAVIGTGINRCYPARNRGLAQQISEKGLILSEFPLDSSPKPGHFPQRNRIISGLSLATLVVEATLKSGSLVTARMALEQNREVMAIPGSIHSPQSQGCHYLLQQGALLVTSAADVLRELGFSIQGKKHVDPQSKCLENKDFIHYLGFEVTTLEQILNRSGWSLDAVASALSTLELEGVVKAVPGGYMRLLA